VTARAARWAARGVCALVVGALGCAPHARYGPPDTISGYDILVTHDDSLSQAIARDLARHGFTVRHAVVGGSRPTAYLFSFTFSETDMPALRWLHVRVADTRTGDLVAWVSAPVDSLGATPEARARAVVDSLIARGSLKRELAPP
jgi:hypothetical protein